MAFTYSWQAAIDFLAAMNRNVPMEKIGAQVCDSVSSEMWSAYPWPDTCTNFAPQLLLDNLQDYDSPSAVFKLVSGQIVRLTPQLESYDPLHVVQSLPYTTAKAHPMQIREFSLERAEGLVRLAFNPSVGVSESYELRGVYQFQHTRIEDVASDTWFKDQLWHVAQEGLLYWGYKLGDRSAKTVEQQYRIFRAKIREAWMQEDAGSADSIYPENGSIGMGG